MNTMEITKVVGGVSGSLLILLLLKMGASSYYLGEAGGEESEAAYTIATAEDDIVEDVAEEVPFIDLVALADITKGERVFNKCASCHSLTAGTNGVGPSLFGIVGREQAGTDFGGYSPALAGLGGTWTVEDLNAFITKPKEYAPGTGMSFGGLPKQEDRVNLIGYLETVQ